MIRKIDRMPPQIERALCELLLKQIEMKKEIEFYRQEIKRQIDFDSLKLFKSMVFEQIRDAAKQIYPSDLIRFFRFNKLLVEERRINEVFFARIIGRNKPFDYKRLNKLLTGENLSAIVHNPGV